MKTLTNEEIMYLLEKCEVRDCKRNECVSKCPLWKECLHFFSGEKIGSCLEEKE